MHQTPFHDWHLEQRARMVPFAGWSMPVMYSSIVQEHEAVRTAVGLFDISHMGRLSITGSGALEFVDLLVTNPLVSLKPGQIRYGLVTNETGGILDDILVYRTATDAVDLVVNASNREKIVSWLQDHLPSDGTQIHDQTFETGMLALQGPQAIDVLAAYVDPSVIELRYYQFTDTSLWGIPTRVSRTGYTGEDGYEFIVPVDQAVKFLQKLLSASSSVVPVVPCGLGCRDTLRIEAAMPLYGHELSEELDPITAGLNFAVSKKKSFIGSDAVAQVREEGPVKKRVGLQLEGRRIAREETPVLIGDEQHGEVTSGTLSPTLGVSIAMAYIDAASAVEGQLVSVDLKGKHVPARIVPLPFYQRDKNAEH